jgi:hypothetical protein
MVVVVLLLLLHRLLLPLPGPMKKVTGVKPRNYQLSMCQ